MLLTVQVMYGLEKVGAVTNVLLICSGFLFTYNALRCQIEVLSYTSSLVQKYIPTVESSPNHTSLPSMAATFLTTCLMVVLQPSGYSVFHGRNTPIQLSLP